ncbi:MAG: HNH endonuclease, partial [Candidatus Nanopelagicales bacterium]
PHTTGRAPNPVVGGASGSREPCPSAGPVPFARLQDGPGIPGHVLERLTCACRIRVVVHDPDHPDNVLDLGRSQRLVSDKQYRALLIRDHGHCAHPGCTSTAYLEGHHVWHWLRGGPTDLDNLVLLCGHHHLAHHRGEFTITSHGHGRFRFYRNGTLLAEHVDPSLLFDTDTLLEDEHTHVAADAAGNRWDGYRMERSYATSCLAVPRYRARDTRRTQQVS